MTKRATLEGSAGPIFVVGAARSGTTLLQYMLRSHPTLSLPTGESHFFIPLYENRSRFGDLRRKDNLRALLGETYSARRHFFDTDLQGIDFDVDEMTDMLHSQGRTTVPGIIAGIFEANARAEGKRRWGDKTPYYSLHLATLLDMFPTMQVVHLVRDGRDCCLSMLQRKDDLRVYNTYHAAYLWSRYVEHARAFGQANPERYFELRYEELTADPEPHLRRLCAFLGEPFDQSLIDFRRAGEAGATPLVAQPLKRGNSGKWRSQMTLRQLRIFEARAAETLAANGYPLAAAEVPLSRPGRWLQEAILSANFRIQQLLRAK